LQNIKVLAVDQEVSQEKEKLVIVRAVTLELKLDQAEIMVQAMQEGTIQLALRNLLDSVVENKAGEVTEVKATPVVERVRNKKTRTQGHSMFVSNPEQELKNYRSIA